MNPRILLVEDDPTSRAFLLAATRALPAEVDLACDMAGRLLRFPYEIPVGTVLGVVGALAFLAILHGRLRHG